MLPGYLSYRAVMQPDRPVTTETPDALIDELLIPSLTRPQGTNSPAQTSGIPASPHRLNRLPRRTGSRRLNASMARVTTVQCFEGLGIVQPGWQERSGSAAMSVILLPGEQARATGSGAGQLVAGAGAGPS